MKIVDQTLLDQQVLLGPYRAYKNFFDERVKESSVPAAIALKAANVASAIFAYPCFGLLAALYLVKNLYTSPDLEGDLLTQPLKGYHRFFVKKIEQALGWRKAAYATAAVAASIFAYPAFGALALAGMFVKLLGVPALIKDNNAEKKNFETHKAGILSKKYGATRDSNPGSHTIERLSFQDEELREVNIESMFHEFDSEIDTLSALFRRVKYSCTIDIRPPNGEGTVNIWLSVEN